MPAPLMLSWKDPTTKTQQSITRSSSLTNNASSPMETDGNPNLLATLSLKSATFDPWTKYTPLLITRHLHSLELLNSISIMKHTTTQQFDFAAKPKVTAVKPKYREETRLDGTNLMNDPRVVRGNTYAAIVENKNDIQPPPRKPPQELPKRKERRINFDTGFEAATPRAVDGRDHFSIQTDPFVETLRDNPIQYEKESQTDLFLDRPVERQFDPMKGKTGVDRTTQIEENDPQLFDFNYEVQPIVDALLSKIIETSRMELYQEKELEEKEKQKEEYERQRHARLAQAQKLEANETRSKEQYDRRQLQYRKSNQQECATQKKVIGRILSKQYLKHLKNNTYKVLDSEGFFRAPLETDLLSSFSPWLYQQIVNELHSRQQFTNATESLVTQAQKDVLRESLHNVNEEKERRVKIQAEREEEIQKKKIEREEKKRLKEEAEKARKEEEQREAQQEGAPAAS